jgi:hypothetical protein
MFARKPQRACLWHLFAHLPGEGHFVINIKPVTGQWSNSFLLLLQLILCSTGRKRPYLRNVIWSGSIVA